jgi:hypothetical protein
LDGETGFDVLLKPLRLAGLIARVIVKLVPLEMAGPRYFLILLFVGEIVLF